MGRTATIAKTINGVEVTQTQFLNEIVDQIDRYGDEGATVLDIARGMGTEWAESTKARQQLAYTLANMIKRNLVYRPLGERGRYKVSQVARRSGVTRFDADERSILAAIRDAGGICRWRDIMEAHDVRPHGDSKEEAVNSAMYRRLTDVIARSELIRQDLGLRGIYNLPWPEVSALPLMGRWAALLSKQQYLEERQNQKQAIDLNEWRNHRDAFFFAVGDAFKIARKRHDKTAEEFVAMPGVRSAVMELARGAPQEVANIKQDWREYTAKGVSALKEKYEALIQAVRDAGEVECDALEDQGLPIDNVIHRIKSDLALLEQQQRDEIAAYQDFRQGEWDGKWMYWLYRRFEEGSVGTHVNAPLTLYTSVAKTLNCCPAALSRGLVTPPMQDKHRSRPMTPRRTPMQKMEDDVRSELIDERQRIELYGEDAVDINRDCL